MRSLSVRLLLSFLVLIIVPTAFAHDITISGTTTFAALDGGSSDHDGANNGVFTVNDGNLTINGTVNCNDGLIGGPCAMTFNVSGNMTLNAGSALYSEDRLGTGSPASITLNVGGNLVVNGTAGATPGAIVSTAALVSSVANGGNVTANVTGTTTIGAGATIDAGSFSGTAGKITVNGSGPVSINGNLYSGPSRNPSGLMGGYLFGGGGLQKGGEIVVKSSTFAEPGVVIGGNAAIITQGETQGTGPISIEGCGVEVKGLVASTSRQNTSSRVSIRSGKNLTVDSRDLGVAGATLGRKGNIRADGMLTGNAQNRGVDLFAGGNITILGPAPGSSSVYPLSSSANALTALADGGTIRIIALAGGVTASGRVADASSTFTGGEGGNINVASKASANLDTAHLRAIGQYSIPVPGRSGGDITVRSHSGNVVWTNGNGDVRPIGSTSGLPPSQQGTITLTACGTVNTMGTTFPANGVPTGVFPVVTTGVCSPAGPSLPVGVAPLITCNTPPVANDVAASTNEDTTVTITLSGSDADGNPLTFSIVSGPANGTLGPIVPTGPTTATVNYSPNLNFYGSDSFVYQANDGNGGTDNATVTITVGPVNDPPSFLAGPTVIVLEDSGPQTYPNWATSISAGPANESGQTVTFTVTNDNNALFAVQPALAPNGTLTFTPAANANGSATITVVAQDNGGTANGGDDTSNPQTSTITMTPVNDEPSFTGGGNVTVNEDSGAYSAAWASAISAGPANESGQNVSFVVSNDNNALFSAQPAISPSGVLTFTPAANANGSATVTVYLTDDGGTANGGDDTSPSVTFTITVNSVNDAPSFTSGGNVTVNEDSGAYSAAWATGISAGPANESGQTVSFNTSNDNNALFAVQPSISPSGVLTFTLASDAFGSATVTVTLSDSGGTANGGVDTSAPQTFTITVNAVNDAPSFAGGGNVTVAEDSGAYSAPWATGINAGPANESGQTVSFNTSNDNNALFSVQPSISPAGVLSFTAAPNAFGTATVTVTLSDNGGTANGGVDTSAPQTFTITITSVPDAPVAANDSWETEGNTELRVDLGPAGTPFVGDTTPSSTGVLDNDSDPIEGNPISITGVVGCADGTAPYDCAVTGGNVSLNSNGTFSFQPSPGATSGSFQYTLSNGVATATGTVSITIHDMIWYVNGSAPAGGDGTSDAPFNDFASLNGGGDVDGAGDYIFVHTSAVAGSIALEPSQKLWGQGIGLIIPRNLNGNGFPTTLVAPGMRPTVTAIAGDTVLVSNVTGVEIAGLNIASPSGNGIDVTSGAAPASATIYSNGVNASAGEGIDINANNAVGTTVAINTTDVVAMGDGINLLATDGNVVFSYSNGSVTSMTGSGIVVNGAAADSLVINGVANVTIGAGTPGQGISVNTARFDANAGTAAFDTVSAGTWTVATNASPTGGTAVSFTNVSGDLAWGSLNAYGTTGGVTIAGSGLFTGVAGMQVTSGGGAISAAAGVGLSVTNTSIGAANLGFTSISSTGTVNGIVVNNTGTAGGLKVLGTGAANSGGTIVNTTGDGISLVNTALAAFNWMSISGSDGNGIFANGVNGLTVANSSVTNSGDAVGEANIRLNQVTGNVAITSSTLNGSYEDEVRVTNSNGVLSGLNITNSLIGPNSVTTGGNGVAVLGTGTAQATISVSASEFQGIRASAFLTNFANTSAQTVSVTGSEFRNNGKAISLGASDSADLTFDILNNLEIIGSISNAIDVVTSTTSTNAALVKGTISGNVIGNANVDSGSRDLFGIAIDIRGDADAVVAVTNNDIRHTDFEGIFVSDAFDNDPDAEKGRLDLTLTGNTVGAPDDNSVAPLGSVFGVRIEARHTTAVCMDMSANSAGSVGGAAHFRVRQRDTSTFNLENFAGSGTSITDVQNYIVARNVVGSTASATLTSGFGGVPTGTCRKP